LIALGQPIPRIATSPGTTWKEPLSRRPNTTCHAGGAVCGDVHQRA
jgi:hypothetical protein